MTIYECLILECNKMSNIQISSLSTRYLLLYFYLLDAQSDLLAVANEDGDVTLYDSSKGYPENKLKCK